MSEASGSAANRQCRRSGDLLHLAVVAVLAFGWSLYWPIADAHSFRQTHTASTVRFFLREGFHLLRPEIDFVGEPGVFVLEFPWYQAVVGLLYLALGEYQFLGRLVAAACTLSAAAFLYAAVREVGPRRTALAAGLLALASPVSVLYGRAYLPDSMGLAACTAVLWLGLRVLQHGGVRPVAAASLAAAGLVAGTLKPPFLVPVLLGLAAVARARWRVGRPTRCAWLRSTAVSLAVPALVTVVAAVAWRLHADAQNTAAGLVGHAIRTFPTWYFFRPEQFVDPEVVRTQVLRVAMALGPAGVALVALGVRGLLRRPRDGLDALSVGLAAGAVLYLAVFLNLTVIHQYYHLPVAWALAPLAARPLSVWAERRPRLAPAAVALSVAVTVAATAVHRRGIGFPWHAGQIRVGREFRSVVPEGRPLTFFVPSPEGHSAPMFLYWADVRGLCAQALDEATLSRIAATGYRYVVVERGSTEAASRRLLDGWPRAQQSGETPHLVVYRIRG
jgi:hypothetical protein